MFEPCTDSLGNVKNGFKLTAQIVAVNSQMSFHNLGKDTLVLTVYKKLAAGAWDAGSVLKIGPNGYATLTKLLDIGIDAVAFDFSADSPKDSSVDFSFASTDSQIQFGALNHFTPAFQKFALDNRVQACRVISMSVLMTNSSSDLNNGGTIDVGNVPRDFNPYDDVAGNLAGLPANRKYQGPAKTGGYAVWNPDQDDEWQPDNLQQKIVSLNDSTFLFGRVRGWGGAGVSSMKMKFDWIVEFYTDNQLFEKVLTPPQTPEFNLLRYVIASMPRATCNPGHVEALKSLLRSAVSAGTKAYGWYDSHRGVIDPAVELALAALA